MARRRGYPTATAGLTASARPTASAARAGRPAADAGSGGTHDAPGDRGRGRGRGAGAADAEDRRSADRDAVARDPVEAARGMCLRLLTAAPRTRAQLADALRRRGVPESAIGEVLGRLGEVGLVDDRAFADAWVSSRHLGRGLGRRALSAELRARGVDGETVASAVAALDPADEEAMARALVERRLRATRGLPPEVRWRRLAGMLARRGYPAALAARVVRAALADDDADPVDTDGYDLDVGVGESAELTDD